MSDETLLNEAVRATSLLIEWHDGYLNGLSPDEFNDLLDRTSHFLTDADPGDENDHDSKYGHGV